MNFWPQLYRWVAIIFDHAKECQRVRPAIYSGKPQKSLQIPTDCWKSFGLEFMSGVLPDHKGRTGLVVFVDRMRKMVDLEPCKLLRSQERRNTYFY